MRLQTSFIDTPIGQIAYAARGAAVCALGFIEQWQSLVRRLERRFGAIELNEERDAAGLRSRVAAYLGGETSALSVAPIDPGGTPFQSRVWAALGEIPPGATISYDELAIRLGAPLAARAVGAANGANPISLIIPCHRVIGKAGDLRGYAGGLDRKRWLLKHEAVGSKGSAFAS